MGDFEALSRLSFVCPLKWEELDGAGAVRSCGQCKCSVTNIDNFSDEQTRALEQKVRDGERVCVAFTRTPKRALLKVASFLFAVSISLSGCANSVVSDEDMQCLVAGKDKITSAPQCIDRAVINSIERARVDDIFEIGQPEQPLGGISMGQFRVPPITGAVREQLAELKAHVAASPESKLGKSILRSFEQNAFEVQTVDHFALKDDVGANRAVTSELSDTMALWSVLRQQPQLYLHWRGVSRRSHTEKASYFVEFIEKEYVGLKTSTFEASLKNFQVAAKNGRSCDCKILCRSLVFALLSAQSRGNSLAAEKRLDLIEACLQILNQTDSSYEWASLASVFDLLVGKYGPVDDGSKLIRTRLARDKELFYQVAATKIDKLLQLADSASDTKNSFYQLEQAYRIWILDNSFEKHYSWSSFAERFERLLPSLSRFNQAHARQCLARQGSVGTISETNFVDAAAINALERTRLQDVYEITTSDTGITPRCHFRDPRPLAGLLRIPLVQLEFSVDNKTDVSSVAIKEMLAQGVFRADVIKALLARKDGNAASYRSAAIAVASNFAIFRQQPLAHRYWMKRAEESGNVALIWNLQSLDHGRSQHSASVLEDLVLEASDSMQNVPGFKHEKLIAFPVFALQDAARRADLSSAKRLRFADVYLEHLEKEHIVFEWAMLTSVYDVLAGRYGTVTSWTDPFNRSLGAYKLKWKNLAERTIDKQLALSDAASNARESFNHLQQAYRIWILDTDLQKSHPWPILAERFVSIAPRLESYNRESAYRCLLIQGNVAAYRHNERIGRRAVEKLFTSLGPPPVLLSHLTIEK